MTAKHYPPWRLPVVGVLGSGENPWQERATQLGRWLGGEGVHLLTGGGAGVMESVSRAFHAVPDRKGLVIGIIPCDEHEPNRARSGYPNRWVEIPVYTHLPASGAHGTAPMSRNHINILSSDVLIALPGGPGTASEVKLALRYGHPLIAYLNAPTEIDGLPDGALIEPDFERVQAFVRSQLDVID